MKKLAFFFLILSFSAEAQNSYLKGFVITLEGDTLFGDIKYNPKKEVDLYKKVVLQVSENEKKTFSARKIMGYSIEGRKFVSRETKFETSVFLNLLSSGKVNFFNYKFVEDGAKEVLTEYYINVGGTDSFLLLSDTKFKKQLLKLSVGDSLPFTEEKLKDVEFEQIIDVVNEYNSTSEDIPTSSGHEE